MAVKINGVDEGSPVSKLKIGENSQLLQLNGNEIMDVLDYRFYQNEKKVTVTFLDHRGKKRKKTVRKEESEELGFKFETYLMDKQRSCRNKCVFVLSINYPKVCVNRCILRMTIRECRFFSVTTLH